MFHRINDAVVSLYVWLRALVTTKAVPERGLGMLEYALMALVILGAFGLIFAFFPGFVEGIFGDIETDYNNIDRTPQSGR